MISVIIATKNGEKYIARAIQSALEQSVAVQNAQDPTEYPGFEIVVVSDGSTDNTAKIVREIGATDPRVKLIELAQNVGPGSARAKGIAQSEMQNPYIAILDDDDSWINPKKLENQISYLEKNPNVLVVGAEKTEFVTESGTRMWWFYHKTDPKVIHDEMLLRCPIINSSVVFRRDAYNKVGGLTSMRLAEDYDLWLRLAQIGDITNIPDTETRYTVRINSASGSNGKERIKLALVVLELVKKYRHVYPNYYKALVKAYIRIVRKFIFKL
ncbi:MAG: glycosyltransferase family 2 protein [Candidatus Pacebacteria bacterium]|nr:glycosyltransferase family 2 protein [Candidatus Paceibacterota bacterium]MBP9818507.1 glycosyltransferase family 2 protein [Candidatus Paceibacterota bacterium]